MDGEIAFAASTVEEDRLGACLFRAGQDHRAPVPRGDARVRGVGASPRSHPGGPRGSSPPRTWRPRSRRQVERIVLSVLRWTSGTLRREPMDRPLPADLALDLNTHRLLLLGMRQFPDAERLERALGPPDRRLRRVSPRPFDYEEVPPRRPSARCSPCARAAPPSRTCWPCRSRARSSCARSTLCFGRGPVEDAPVPRPPAAPAAARLRLRPRLAYSRRRGPAARPRPERPRTPEDAERAGARLPREGPPRARDRGSCRMRPTATPRRAAPAGCWR